MANKISDSTIKLNIQPGTERTLYATWSWSKANTKEYQVQWQYSAGHTVWFEGSSSTVKLKNALYNIPTNGCHVRFRVKPVSKTHKVNDKDTNYWTASWSNWVTYKVTVATDHTPETPAVPTVSVTNFKLTATLDSYDSNTKFCQFELVMDDKTTVAKHMVKKEKAHLSTTFNVTAGHTYKVRARGGYTNKVITKLDGGHWSVTVAANKVKEDPSAPIVIGAPIGVVTSISDYLEYGKWSQYSGSVGTKPLGVGAIRPCALTETSVKIYWDLVPLNITGYEIEYTTNKQYFKANPSGVSKVNLETTAKFGIITGLETGTIYYFRMRAVNSEGVSGWTKVASAILGTVPNPPTTWSSGTTAVLGDDITLYWIHNSTDGSEEKGALVKLLVDGSPFCPDIDIKPPASGKTVNEHVIKTNIFTKDTELSWAVRTKGILEKFSEYSITRTINIYQSPMIYINIYKTNKWWWDPFNFEEDSIYTALGDFADPYETDEIIKQYPIFIVATTEPTTQKPVSAHFSIFSTESYTEISATGEEILVKADDEIFSYDPDLNRMLKVSVGYQIAFVLLPNNVYLENDVLYRCVFTVAMDNGLAAETEFTFKIQLDDDEYDLDAEIGYDKYTVSTSITPRCVMPDENETEVEEDYNLVSGVRLSVYRRDFDGQFVELIRNIDNLRQTTITDPHPTLGFTRYRIVATDNTTGKIFFTDLPAYPIPERAIILQWDQKWQEFDGDNPDEMVEPAFSGSFLKLPYNISVADNASPNVEMVEYIGRKHPVAYYGTQVGQTSSWSFDIVRDDVETLYALRRLSRFMGDVYVREPNGSGYWANIKINWNIDNKAVIIPVTLNVTRVEGGV